MCKYSKLNYNTFALARWSIVTVSCVCSKLQRAAMQAAAAERKSIQDEF